MRFHLFCKKSTVFSAFVNKKHGFKSCTFNTSNKKNLDSLNADDVSPPGRIEPIRHSLETIPKLND